MPRAKSFTIRKRVFPHLTGPRWEVDCGLIEGKRLRKFFKSKAAATDFVEDERQKLKRHGETAVGLTHSDRVLFQAARDRLAAAGATINQAVDYFLQRHRPVKESLSLRVLLARCVLDKELSGVTDRYLKQLPSSCRSFMAGREDLPAAEVTRQMVKEWILGHGFAPKTQKTYLGDLRTLLSWAKQEHYLAENPLEGEEGYIQLASDADREIQAFAVEHCVALLKTALLGSHRLRDKKGAGPRYDLGFRVLLGYLVVAMFCGVRPDELRKTTVKEMDLRERALIVQGGRAKTGKRRVIELPRVAVVWLRLWRRLCPEEERFLPVNFDRKWKSLRAAAVPGLWFSDALRHTTATFHYAKYQQPGQIKALLGHSETEETLHRHYRAVRTIDGRMVTKKMAELFWGLTPRKARLWK